MPYGRLYAPDTLACHSRFLLAVLNTWLGFVRHRVGNQTNGVPLPSPEPEPPQEIGTSIHVFEYEVPICQPRAGRFITATSKVLYFASAAGLLTIIVPEFAAPRRLVG